MVTAVEDEEPASSADVEAEPSASVARSTVVAVLVGLGIAVAVAALVYSIVAVPIYLLASNDPNGLNRPLVRVGLFQVAIPIGLLVGALAGGAVGVWYARGGRLPRDRSPYEY